MDSSSISPFAWKSGSFSISSAKMHPTDHMSTAVEYFVAPSRISGALRRRGGDSVVRGSRRRGRLTGTRASRRAA